MVQIDQLQERLQGSFTPTYMSNNYSMVERNYVTNEEAHVMVEDEVHVGMHVIEEATFKEG